jgi:hypothetical protein
MTYLDPPDRVRVPRLQQQVHEGLDRPLRQEQSDVRALLVPSQGVPPVPVVTVITFVKLGEKTSDMRPSGSEGRRCASWILPQNSGRGECAPADVKRGSSATTREPRDAFSQDDRYEG